MPIPQLSSQKNLEKTWKEINPKKAKKRRFSQVLFRSLLLALLVVFLLVLIGGVVAFIWFSRDLPDPDKLLTRDLAQSTKIYDRSGETVLYEIHGEEKRTVINLEDIPDHMKWATIAIEDQNFYEHRGFSFRRIVKSIWVNIVQRRRAQGASTITQQFVKNAILTTEKTYTRKIKELVLSIQIERKFSKDQILKMYLNEIPYGSNTYGVESAAQTYFNKSAKDLTLAEAALLAALPQAPTYYSPFGSHQDRLLARQQFILEEMANLDYISQEEAEAAQEEDVLEKISPKREGITAPHFVMYVKEELTAKYGEKMVEQGGLKVYTTLDTYKQKIAEEEVEKGAEKNETRYGAKNAALVALDPKTGEILAMVGSRDYFDTENDGNVNVTIRERQPGSSFKPIAYATAFNKGYTPKTMLFDLTTTFAVSPKAYTPRNYDLTEHGPVSMRQALAGSLNIPAVKTLYLAGINNVLDLAHQMGYTTLNDRDRYGLSLVLGGGEVKLIDHVAAFSVFAREGLRHSPYAILKVEDKNGKILEKNQPQETKVLETEIARQINSILSDNSARAFVFGTQNYLNLGARPVAAKTGTTNDFRDAWTIGYTPSLASGVWVGNNDNSKMGGGAAGSVVAAPIWHGFMKRVLGDTPVETFKYPKEIETDKPILNGQIDQIIKKKVDKITGKLIPDSCLETYPQKYVLEKEFKITHNILHYVNKDNPLGPVPENPTLDPQYQRWEESVQKWAQSNGYYTKELAYEDCSLREGKPEVTIISPQEGATINNQEFTMEAGVTSEKEIKKVKFYLNNELINTLTEAPYRITHQTQLASGYYTIQVVAYDEADNTDEDQININLLIENNESSVYFTQPNQATTLKISDFPYDLSASVFQSKGTKKVEFYYLDSTLENPENILIGRVNDPAYTLISLPWETSPSVGDYKIFLIATDKERGTVQTDNIKIKIIKD